MQRLELPGPAARFDGAADVERLADGGLQVWRMPRADAELMHPGLTARCLEAAGVRLSIFTDSPVLEVSVGPSTHNPAERASEFVFDLCVDGKLHERRRCPIDRQTLRFEGWGPGEHRLELWLPVIGAVAIYDAAIAAGATASERADPRPTWVTYGSSITQCGGAAGPSETWPAIVAERLGLRLIGLGFGGHCHVDPIVGRFIRDHEAAFLSVCLGVNVHGQGSIGPRAFRPVCEGLVQTIREGHPRTPLAVISPIHASIREDKPSEAGLTFDRIREDLRELVEALQRRGDDAIRYIDGRKLLGEADAELLSDEVHPSAEGYRHMAEAFVRVVAPTLGMESRPAAGV
jgi:hypothetical protein